MGDRYDMKLQRGAAMRRVANSSTGKLISTFNVSDLLLPLVDDAAMQFRPACERFGDPR